MTQEYLESLGEFQKHRGEELIQKAKEWREEYMQRAGSNRSQGSASASQSQIQVEGGMDMPSSSSLGYGGYLLNPSLTGIGTISPSPSFEEFKFIDSDYLVDHESLQKYQTSK